MDEAAKWRWDVRLGIAAPLLTVIGVLVGVWQFVDGQKAATRLEYSLLASQNAVSFRRELWLEQLKTYKAISELVGKIVSAADTDGSPEAIKKLAGEFVAQYWGFMIFVEDEKVESGMKAFNIEINDYFKERSSPDRLKKRAARLVQALRDSSAERWQEIHASIGIKE